MARRKWLPLAEYLAETRAAKALARIKKGIQSKGMPDEVAPAAPPVPEPVRPNTLATRKDAQKAARMPKGCPSCGYKDPAHVRGVKCPNCG